MWTMVEEQWGIGPRTRDRIAYRGAIAALAASLFSTLTPVGRAEASPEREVEQCVAADEPMTASVADLEADPRAFEGRAVVILARPVLGEPLCTQKACYPSDACCNRCVASFFLMNEQTGWAAIEIAGPDQQSLGCTGDDCALRDCGPIDPEAPGLYRFEGVFTSTDDGRPQLLVERLMPAT